MKDGLLLLLAGMVCFVGAWAFWHYTGQAAYVIVEVITVLYWIDWWRRRRKQKRPPPAG